MGYQVTASITAENTFSSAIKITGQANFTLSGTWSATASLQRTRNGTNANPTWDDVTDESGGVLTWTGNVTAIINEPADSPDVLYRFGVKTGNFTSGTLVGEIRQ